MNTRKRTPKTYIITGIVLLVFLLLITIGLLFLHYFPAERRTDYKRLSSETYDTVFLSMYPTDNFEEEDFAHYRGMTTVITDYEIPDFPTLQKYFKHIGKSGNSITTMYLGIIPDKVNPQELIDLLQNYPGIRFEIILSHPSLDYWLKLSETDFTDLLQSYKEFALAISGHEMVSAYLYSGTEWMIANPVNYEEMFLTTSSISETIMLHSDRDHAYVLTDKNVEAKLEEMTTLLTNKRNTPPVYPDLSNWNIVFLGDSVFANFTDSSSIPGVVNGLTGANTFNLAKGGASATEHPDNNISFPDLANTLSERNISYIPEEETQLHTNIQDYLQASEAEQLCFIINYGLNDFFSGLPLASEDTRDIYTFEGAIRTAVTTLQQTYPDALIILATPNFTCYYGNGTIGQPPSLLPLETYVNSLSSLAEELQVELLDNYNELPINSQNWAVYLNDGCHPNEIGRFIMGEHIVLKLSQY